MVQMGCDLSGCENAWCFVLNVSQYEFSRRREAQGSLQPADVPTQEQTELISVMRPVIIVMQSNKSDFVFQLALETIRCGVNKIIHSELCNKPFKKNLKG